MVHVKTYNVDELMKVDWRGSAGQMILLKGCPKCSGDLIIDRDTFGRYFKCLQCGLLRDVTDGYGKSINTDPYKESEAA